jgi:hypothetical protein
MIIVMEECPDMSTYIRTQWVTDLKSFGSIEYEFVIRSKREGDSKSGSGKSQKGSIISRLVPEGFETLPVIYRKVSEEIRLSRSKVRNGRKGPEGYGRFRKVPGRPELS